MLEKMAMLFFRLLKSFDDVIDCVIFKRDGNIFFFLTTTNITFIKQGWGADTTLTMLNYA